MRQDVTKVGPKYQVTIPKEVREALGLKVGDLVQAAVGKDKTIVLRRKRLVDFDAELEEALAEAEADYKAGRVLGPFDTAEETVAALKGQGLVRRDAEEATRRVTKTATITSAMRRAVKRRPHARAAHK
jgi:AbrB family looped-hinge helix DNA binding protein